MKYITVIWDKCLSVKTGKIDNAPQNDDFDFFFLVYVQIYVSVFIRASA